MIHFWKLSCLLLMVSCFSLDDLDRDGYTVAEGDCDDHNRSIHPGVGELCDGIDNNCDGRVDEEGAINADLWYLDDDQDGWGIEGETAIACQREDNFAFRAGDCDDLNAEIHPGADEFCDSVDSNCDGIIDEQPVDGILWYPDVDGDGFGDDALPFVACVQPDGYTELGKKRFYIAYP